MLRSIAGAIDLCLSRSTWMKRVRHPEMIKPGERIGRLSPQSVCASPAHHSCDVFNGRRTASGHLCPAGRGFACATAGVIGDTRWIALDFVFHWPCITCVFGV